ncbi:glycosyltransferase family 2 protein [Sneathiella sp.]|uniref:glycosyltransferase family 2 protein n=1 Tax=Sneathiella sp. TaxID=1964365 RepID=UPI0035634EE5
MNITPQQNTEIQTPPKLTIIVISYNTRAMTLKCIETVFAETRDTSFELIILDNASTDGSAEALMDRYSDKATVICSAENLGFAAANNVVAKQASGEFLLLLNPDTEVLDGAIDKLVAFSESRPEARIWGGGTVFPDKRLNPASSWGRMTYWSLISTLSGLSSVFKNTSIFNVEGMGGWDRQGDKYVDIITGCFLLIQKNFWEELGGFDKDFFMYGEEADLCLRATKLGARPLATSRAIIIHHGGASETVQSDKMVRLLNAKVKLIQKHFSPGSGRFAVYLLTLWPLSRYLAHSILAAAGWKSSQLPASVWKNIWGRRTTWRNPAG